MCSQAMSISIIIPVLHEASVVNVLVDHIRKVECGERPEIIVVDGDPAEGTLKAISRHDVRKITSPRGRGVQMNAGAREAEGGILLFLHADTELPPDALRLVEAAMHDDGYVGGAFDLGIRSERFVFRVIEGAASLRSRLTKVPFGDQAVFLRRDYFEEIGGYKEIPVMEDVEIMGRIRKRGDKIFIIPRRVLTSPRRWEKEGVLRCTMRNWLLQILYLLGISPRRFSQLYRQG